MGKLEGWVGRCLRPLLESIDKAKATAKALADDRAQKIESIIADNVKMRQNISQLTNIIENMKRLNDEAKMRPTIAELISGPSCRDSSHGKLLVDGQAMKGRLDMVAVNLTQILNSLGKVPMAQTKLLLMDTHRMADIGVIVRRPPLPWSTSTTDSIAKEEMDANRRAVSYDDTQLKRQQK